MYLQLIHMKYIWPIRTNCSLLSCIRKMLEGWIILVFKLVHGKYILQAKATEILFLVLRILFFKIRVGGRNKIKNKIFLQVPVHIEYWMSEILHSIYNMMGFRRNKTSFQQWYFIYYVR